MPVPQKPNTEPGDFMPLRVSPTAADLPESPVSPFVPVHAHVCACVTGAHVVFLFRKVCEANNMKVSGLVGILCRQVFARVSLHVSVSFDAGPAKHITNGVFGFSRLQFRKRTYTPQMAHQFYETGYCQ